MSLLDAGTRVYAIGDVHGRFDLLEAMHDAIAADLSARPPGRSVVVHLGDYVDRGPRTHDVIERLLTPRLTADEIVCLKGNHEDCLLQFIAGGDDAEVFLRYGGVETMGSYGVDPTSPALLGHPDHLVAAFDAHLPSRHRHFLETLPLSFGLGGYFFCHAGVRPGVPLDQQAPRDLIWIREPFLGSTEFHGRVVVHGHTPVDAPESLPNRINVDTGAVFTGRLTAVVLEGDGRRFLTIDGGL